MTKKEEAKRKKRFGRLKSIDPRDKEYPMRMLTALEAPSRTAPWNAPPAMDQGFTSACTGYSGAHLLAAAPHLHRLDDAMAVKLYTHARKNDEYPGENYEGSTVRGLIKGMVELGCIHGGYYWAWDAETVKDYVRRYSPVITGTDWYSEMMETDKQGYIWPNGPMEGGHAYCILGYSDEREAFRIQNSWGQSWGSKGRAWLTFDSYQFLLERDGGEAVAAMEIRAWY